MLPLVRDLALAYIAFTLLVTGTFHVIRFRDLRQLVKAQGIVRASLTDVAAAALAAFEVAVGTLALASVMGEQREPWIPALSALAGLAFVLYVRRLLGTRPRPLSCGCSPVAGGVTRASLLPAATLLAMGVAALLAQAVLGSVGPEQWEPPASGRALATGWGFLLAWSVMLVPAVVPQPDSRRDHGLAHL